MKTEERKGVGQEKWESRREKERSDQGEESGRAKESNRRRVA